MKNLRNKIHLSNILTCINEIDNYCADLTQEQMQDEELRMLLYRNLTMLGMEASHVQLEHPSIRTLKSFEKADYINGLGRDTYAIFNFIVNDLSYLKNIVVGLVNGKKRLRGKKKMAMA
ncbi:hypothetical protein C900_05242 [Fulvivirga imtechensis AK7]|uniref:Uncharacterized protein n=1 Tax=Fulvivirga imtechensis AK7 TaxID=1237149 RepID=L8JYF2_9BACT|nr:hypothetical protein [Fulvivirga imtechensis]ELR73193.1 hypothetical protein C900_05242 [Fulvivirga imtechensis AK7]